MYLLCIVAILKGLNLNSHGCKPMDKCADEFRDAEGVELFIKSKNEEIMVSTFNYWTWKSKKSDAKIRFIKWGDFVQPRF